MQSRIAALVLLALTASAYAEDVHVVVLKPIAAAEKEKAASLPKMSLAEFEALVKQPGVKVMMPDGVEKTVAGHAAARAAFREEFKKLFPGRAEPVQAKEGGAGELRLLGTDEIVRDMVTARQSLRSPEDRRSAYAELHAVLTGIGTTNRKVAAAMKPLPKPDALAQQDFDAVQSALRGIFGAVIGSMLSPPPIVVSAAPPACSAEEGVGAGADSDASSAAFSPAGLHELASWPLESFMTCVRNQGRRGTSAAFALCAAAEALAAVQAQRFLNLSEQDLHRHAMLDWDPEPPFCEDGASVRATLSAMIASGYKFPFEKDWEYDPVATACPTTSHGAREVCARVSADTVSTILKSTCSFLESLPSAGKKAGWTCEAVRNPTLGTAEVLICSTPPVAKGTSDFNVTGQRTVWDGETGDVGWSEAIDRARCYLALRKPIVLEIAVPPSWRDVGANGYVRLAAAPEEAVGNHAICVSGAILNKELPKGAPEGGGGGWFVVKDSWGTSHGDAGYVYVEFAWVKRWGHAMTAVWSVGR